MMELLLFLVLTFSCVFTAEATNHLGFLRSLEILDEAIEAIKRAVELEDATEDLKTEEPDDDDIFGPRYAEVNINGVRVAIPEEDQLQQESNIDIGRTVREMEPDQHLKVSYLIILTILIAMFGTFAVLFCCAGLRLK